MRYPDPDQRFLKRIPQNETDPYGSGSTTLFMAMGKMAFESTMNSEATKTPPGSSHAAPYLFRAEPEPEPAPYI